MSRILCREKVLKVSGQLVLAQLLHFVLFRGHDIDIARDIHADVVRTMRATLPLDST